MKFEVNLDVSVIDVMNILSGKKAATVHLHVVVCMRTLAHARACDSGAQACARKTRDIDVHSR